MKLHSTWGIFILLYFLESHWAEIHQKSAHILEVYLMYADGVRFLILLFLALNPVFTYLIFFATFFPFLATHYGIHLFLTLFPIP